MRQHPKQGLAYEIAMRHRGLKEIPGPQHSEEVLDFFKAVGHGWVKDDETAWCAAFVGAMLHEAGLKGTGKLNARSYLEWGQKVPLDNALPGDIVVFWRGSKNSWKGHVGFYVGHNEENVQVLGGNQRNAVNVSNYARSRLLHVRRLAAPVDADPPEETKPSASVIQTIIALIGGLFGGRR